MFEKWRSDDHSRVELPNTARLEAAGGVRRLLQTVILHMQE